MRTRGLFPKGGVRAILPPEQNRQTRATHMQIRHMAWVLSVAILGAGTGAWAGPESSIRPMPRAGLAPVEAAQVSITVSRSIRPQARDRAALAQPRPETARPTPVASNPAGFTRWSGQFRARALRAGITASTFDRAFAQATYLPRVIERDRNQSEFTKQLWEYLDSAVSSSRVANGRDAYRRYQRVLDAIERAYGVEGHVVAAVWGLETAYGAIRGDTNIISAMATLAYDGRRKRFFEAQLIAALRILQAGDVSMDQMQGSWAGAMGHTQFMPDSFLRYAVDANGDGKRDIWSDNPVDALASTANYLRQRGWTKGQPWGMEVRLPRDFDFSQSGERIKKRASDWNAMGVRQMNGDRVPDHGPASILVPAGANGAAFVIFNNFHVLETYNPADAYVIGVGHLSDRILGRPAIQASWPRGDRPLSLSERRELQQRLSRAGCPPGKYDGIIGPNTIEAVRCYQRGIGQIPDGYASMALLRRLRG